MNSNIHGGDRHARTVRAWQLAILRFAVTLDNADRLAVMAIANEIDKSSPQHDGKPAFNFFRRTSAQICAAILQPDEPGSAVLQHYHAQIEDDRIKRVFAAATGVDRPKLLSVRKPRKQDTSLWRGLSRGRPSGLRRDCTGSQ